MPTLRSLDSAQVKNIDRDSFLVCSGLNADFRVDDPLCDAACHFTIQREPTGYTIQRQHEVSVNGKSIPDRARLNAGDRICVGSTLLVFENTVARDDMTRIAAPDDGHDYEFEAEIRLEEGMPIVLGRESTRVVRRLDHPLVSRRHAQFIRHGQKVTVQDMRSSNGTFVNGHRISKPTTLSYSDRVGIGPFHFVWIGDRMQPVNQPIEPTRGTTIINSDLSCRGLTRTVAATGQDLLRDISVRMATGTFSAIVGPSGAGKSTLLKALANREPVGCQILCEGKITFANVDLVDNFQQLKQQIAVVPQHEILFDDLTLEASLRYTAAIRLPTDASRDEVGQGVRRVLETVGLADCAQTFVGKLSGGQRKRAALANELLSDPGLLLLDEVTSGLDELTDSEMMTLFAEIAGNGKTVACVTHSVSSVDTTCDQLIALTQFGRLGFAGKPDQALAYFGVPHLRSIYSHLLAQTPQEADVIAQRFRDSQYYTEIVEDAPNGSSEINLRSAPLTRIDGWVRNVSQITDLDVAFSFRQFGVLVHRYARRILGDSRANLMRLLQVLIVAGLLGLVFGTELNPAAQINCAFILCLSSYWFGCNNSAKEIVRERPIFEQERDIVVQPHSYAWSKFLPLSGIALAQSIGLLIAVRWWCGIPGAIAAWCLLISGVAIAGTATGLAISASSRNEEIAAAAVPIALIPQIILAGAVATLSGAGLWIAKIGITSYWGLESAKEVLSSPDRIPSHLWTAMTVVALQTLLAFYLTMYGLQQKHR